MTFVSNWRRINKFWLSILVLSLGLLLAASPSMGQSAPRLSSTPPNPEFLKYLDAINKGAVRTVTESGRPLGYIPPPFKLDRARKGAPLPRQAAALPAAFDLRKKKGLTPVRNQGECGACWTFGTYASLESYLKLRLRQNWDFSEADMNESHGFDYPECAGGNCLMSTAYLVRWSGPIQEEDAPYGYAQVESVSGSPVRKHVQNVDIIPDRSGPTDNDDLKTAVMTHGAVAASILWKDVYYRPDTYGYYNNRYTTNDHVVAIVGWDDRYPATNFKNGIQPPGDGAFIVKNSWGADWGDGGYFYLSYYDKSIAELASFNSADNPSRYTRAYEYDPLGWTGSLSFKNQLGRRIETGWMANVFMAAYTAPRIKAVSFYTPVPNSKYQVIIRSNVKGADPSAGQIVKKIPAKGMGEFAYAGYHTVSFDASPAVVTGGRKFSVVVKLITPGFDPIAYEAPQKGYSSGAKAFKGQSYISADGKRWHDLTASKAYRNANVCIKAFATK